MPTYKIINHYGWLISLLIGLTACGSINEPQVHRQFTSSFEQIDDFKNFYIAPGEAYASFQELTTEKVYDGTYAHKAEIVEARATDNDGTTYLPHRAYPTIQLYKLNEGAFRTPCLISLYVYLDMELQQRPAGHINDWFSFVTLTPDASDQWARTVGINLVYDHYVHLMHVPQQGKSIYIYQATSANDTNGERLFKNKQWNRLDVLIDFSATNGYAKVWLNKQLVSHATVEGGHGKLEQAHFGLYASAALDSGVIYNDKLRIVEVSNEQEATNLLNDTW